MCHLNERRTPRPEYLRLNTAVVQVLRWSNGCLRRKRSFPCCFLLGCPEAATGKKIFGGALSMVAPETQNGVRSKYQGGGDGSLRSVGGECVARWCWLLQKNDEKGGGGEKLRPESRGASSVMEEQPMDRESDVVRAYASNKPWLIGFLMDYFGALLMLRALSLAPVSVIQPVSGCGLAILSVFSHFYLKEVMNAVDWLGITLAGLGTIGNELVQEERSKRHLQYLSYTYLGWHVVLIFVCSYALLCCISLGTSEWMASYLQTSTKRARAGTLLFNKINICIRTAVKPIGLILRLMSIRQKLQISIPPEKVGHGLTLNLSYICKRHKCPFFIIKILFIKCRIASVISKMGFVFLEQGFSALLVPICISISICCNASGFVYQTRGLKHGRAVVVSTCAAVASIVTGVLAGMFALGERLPKSPTSCLGFYLDGSG
ncbi:hypothetical protein LXL04_008183 [Taraxacum kok-saghyz]